MRVGIDLTYIPRFKNKTRLAEHILSDDELLEYNNSSNKAQYLASRFALKEALLKALELSILSVDLKLIKSIKKDNGAIYLEYDGKKYDCSLSHEKNYSVGIVLND
jgi:phosphopantetheine--protein transferase-like protein